MNWFNFFTAAIIVVTLVGVAIGRYPGLKMNRATIALVGATLLVALGTLTLVGDGVHNFFDGVAIAAAFMVSPPLGITTTFAIALHEIPQEIGDFGLLLYSGYTPAKALAFNLLSALAAVAGGVGFFFFSSYVEHLEAYALAMTAGMFIYIASADLLPELHKEKKARASALQLALMLLGAAAIWMIARTLK